MGMMHRHEASENNAGDETVLTFSPRLASSKRGSTTLPLLLASRAVPDPATVVARRRLVLNMRLGGMMDSDEEPLTINHRRFDIDRIDEEVELGAVEIWKVSGQKMAHPSTFMECTSTCYVAMARNQIFLIRGHVTPSSWTNRSSY